MQRVNVCFNGECVEVAAIQHPFDAEKIDYSRTIENGESVHHLEHPNTEPFDRESLVVCVSRHVEDLETEQADESDELTEEELEAATNPENDEHSEQN